MERNILLIHPQRQIFASCRRILSQRNFRVIASDDPLDAASLFRQHNPCLVLTGVRMKGRDGFDVLQDVRIQSPNVPVIAIVTHASIAGAVQFMNSGGSDYLPNPFGADQLIQSIDRALSKVERIKEDVRQNATEKSGGTEIVEQIIGSSSVIRQLREDIEKVAATDVHVLITGETGTGKELTAREIHSQSDRSAKPFMIVDCAALPPGLIESEMFGHARGAFTGAERARKGLLQSGEHGTIFLDEIGELELASQGRLLRLLEDGSIRRVGESVRNTIDLRFIAATNRDLHVEAVDGSFRKDLYYRLKVVEIFIPPLRKRKEDVPLLAVHFYNHFRIVYGEKNLPHLKSDLLELLSGYDWPGNIRELKNLLERIVVLAKDPETIQLEVKKYLAKNSRSQSVPEKKDLLAVESQKVVNKETVEKYGEMRDGLIDRFDRAYFMKLFKKNNGNISAMARQAGMTRKSIYRKLSQLHISAD